MKFFDLQIDINSNYIIYNINTYHPYRQQMNKNMSMNNVNNNKNDDFTIPLKSVSKFENKSINIESIVKNGETRNFLNNLAKNMLEDLKEFSSQSVDLFNVMNEKITHEYHMYLKHACNL